MRLLRQGWLADMQEYRGSAGFEIQAVRKKAGSRRHRGKWSGRALWFPAAAHFSQHIRSRIGRSRVFASRASQHIPKCEDLFQLFQHSGIRQGDFSHRPLPMHCRLLSVPDDVPPTARRLLQSRQGQGAPGRLCLPIVRPWAVSRHQLDGLF